MKVLRLCLLCLILAMLWGCSPKGQPLLPQSDAAARWQSFVQRSSGSGHFDVLSGSLRFGPANDTQRVTYLLWSGNDAGNATSSRTIRLDVGAPAGSTLGSLLFKDGRMTLILPQERRAYVGEASKRNLRRMLNLPLPFDMQGLNAVLAGRLYSVLDEPEPERYEMLSDGGIVYRWRKGGAHCELELSPQALPVRWTVSGSWDMSIGSDAQGFPSKLSGQMENDGETLRLVLLVKERRPGKDLPPSSLRLDIPAGFDVISID
jgi:outer membrane biogenesis lipoprotein LolB